MNTRLLQTVSLAVLGVCGVVGLFAPEVLLSAINMAFVTPHWPVQLLAAAWLGLATLNWSTRGFAMGGILGRPVVLVMTGRNVDDVLVARARTDLESFPG